MKKSRRVPIIILIIFSNLLNFILISGFTKAGPIDAQVNLFLQDDTIMADVSNASEVNPTIVIFTGWVSVEANPSTTVIVELTVTDTWQLTTIAPTAMQFSDNDTKSRKFTVEIKIPYIIDCDESDQVTVFCSASVYPPGKPVSSNYITGKILIEKYHNFRVGYYNKHREIRPGDDVEISISISNRGNGEEIFITTIKNLDDLRKIGFQIDPPQPVKILPDQNGKVVISMETPSDLVENKLYKIEIEIKPKDKINYYVPIQNLTFSLKARPGSSPIWANLVCSAFIIFVIVIIILIGFFIYKSFKNRKLKK